MIYKVLKGRRRTEESCKMKMVEMVRHAMKNELRVLPLVDFLLCRVRRRSDRGCGGNNGSSNRRQL